ncbi:MAG: AI-2E family transporter [Candidatus Binatia bacterium]
MVNLLWSASELPALLLSIAALALMVSVLSHAQAVFIPLALAMMLTFILIPPVERLERYMPRLLAVSITLICTLSILSGFTFILYDQFNDLASQLPRYSVSIKEKFAALRSTRNSAIENIAKTVDEVSRQLDQQEEKREKDGRTTIEKNKVEMKRQLQPVMVVESEPTDVKRLWLLAEPMFEPLMTSIIVIVLVAFMLVQREELRNRFIRLVGDTRLSLTTKIMDEVGQKISSFLFTQLVINASYGCILSLGLWCIGIPYAVLWGVMAALFRFVPFVGSFISMILPLALAFVIFSGWRGFIATFSLFIALDIITAHVVEPFLIGQKVGASSLALLVMALFWTWLWGPIGLLLATPITVCLVVLGKYVPRCALFSVLLGDEPALPTEVSVYQRLLAGDEEEAAELVTRELQENSTLDVYDSVLVPTLLQATRDLQRGDITQTEHDFVLQVIRDLVNDLGQGQQQQNTIACARLQESGEPVVPVNLLIIPARSKNSAIVMDMLHFVLDHATCAVHTLSTEALASEVLVAVERECPILVVITVMPPGGNSQARYLCKRLRSHFPRLRILIVRPGVDSNSSLGQDSIVQSFLEAGADKVALQLSYAVKILPQMVFPSVLRVADVQAETLALNEAVSQPG